MNKIHLILQGKGGVGKSFVASLLAQYYGTKSVPVTCIDTDPVNATFAGYSGIDAERISLMDGTVLNERNFDGMIERIVAEDKDFIIDNGASSFIPLSNYLLENGVFAMLRQYKRRPVVHSVITGGQAMGDTLAGLSSTLTATTAENPVVVWVNEFFGDVVYEGAGFEDMAVYQDNREKIAAIIRIPRQSSSTFGKDVQLMLEKKLTFADVAKSADFGLMAKQRLATVQRSLFDQIEQFGVAA